MSRLLERYAEILERLRAELSTHSGLAWSLSRYSARSAAARPARIPTSTSSSSLGTCRGRTARVDEFLPVEARVESWLSTAPGAVGPVMLSPVFKTPAEVEAGSPLFLDMIDDARVLHDTDGFFKQYLDGFRRRLEVLGSRRIWLGNAWYWELKPDLKPGEVFTL